MSTSRLVQDKKGNAATKTAATIMIKRMLNWFRVSHGHSVRRAYSDGSFIVGTHYFAEKSHGQWRVYSLDNIAPDHGYELEYFGVELYELAEWLVKTLDARKQARISEPR